MRETTVYSNDDMDFQAAMDSKGECDEHPHLIANHVMGASSFTAMPQSQLPFETPPQRFTLAILIDRDAAERGPWFCDELVMSLLDQFRALLSDMVGAENVNGAIMAAMVQRMADTIGVEDTEEVVARQLEKKEGRRRGDSQTH